MTTYRITGRQDGIDYGCYVADTKEQAILEMLDDAGLGDAEPIIDNFTVEAVEWGEILLHRLLDWS